jgi:hypothetical protein
VLNYLRQFPERRDQNAHTRRIDEQIDPTTVIVRGKTDVSGRLGKCIPIGEWRDSAYRVRRNLLTEWGGVSSNDGYIQRAVPYRLLDPERFYNWFNRQNIPLVRMNN